MLLLCRWGTIVPFHSVCLVLRAFNFHVNTGRRVQLNCVQVFCFRCCCDAVRNHFESIFNFLQDLGAHAVAIVISTIIELAN